MADRRQFLKGLGFAAVGATAIAGVFGLHEGRYGAEGLTSEPQVYECGGQFMFPIYAEDGGITTRNVSYLIAEKNGVRYRYGFEVDGWKPSWHEAEKRARQEFLRHLENA